MVIRRLYARDHLDQVLATFALILIFSEGTRWLFGSFPLYLDVPAALSGPVHLPGGIAYPAYRLAIIVIGFAVAAGLFLLIAKTRIGMRIRAGESDREMIGALGVNISVLYTAVFALGAALAGFAGALTQAILPIRGKILNVASASADKIRANSEIADLSLAMGCGTRKDCDRRICAMTGS